MCAWRLQGKFMSKFLTSICSLLIFTSLSASVALAQFESGTILGTVRDPTGAIVPNATVRLENTKTAVRQEAKSDSNGDYTFVNVRLGNYEVIVEAVGFQTAKTAPFDLSIN